jgi:hypothetical protein
VRTAGTQLTGTSSAPSSTALSVERIDDQLVVRIGNRTFTSYRFGRGQKYPYFYPVNGPLSGESLTTESSQPYPHHRSLFFGCDKVNGGNYWQEGNELGQIISQGPTITLNGPDVAEFRDLCSWRQPGREPVIEESRTIRITAPGAAIRLIDFSTTLVALVPIKIEKTNHSLFAARMRPELSALQGGVLVNAEGALGEKGTAGVASPWADYSGTLFGQKEGLAIFDSPRNPWFPSRWFTREYGFFSPTPFNWLDEKGVQLRTGESLRLQYRTVVHAGDASAAGIAELYRRWAGEQAGAAGSFQPPRSAGKPRIPRDLLPW